MSLVWLADLKRLNAIAESALAFTPQQYDKERYEEIVAITNRMIAQLTDRPLEQITQVLCQDPKRYVTPQVEVRAAVIHDNKILLVQERSDKLWTMPGGYADMGESATESVIKEVREEASLDVTVSRLISLRHKAKGNYRPDVREFYKIYFLCEASESAMPHPGHETMGAAFFSIDDLPPLSRGRTIERDIEDAFRVVSNPDYPIAID